MIVTINLNKKYRQGKIVVPAVCDINLKIDSGEIVSLFGRSGSGKTTLLNLIGTLYKPDSGEILYNGTKLSSISGRELPAFRRKNTGFVFQHFNLIPYLSAIENVELPMKFDGIPKKQRRERANEILTKLGLSDRLDFTLSQLSGGQIQRAAFARAVVMKPAIVLADEPTGQLDSKTAQELAEMIGEMNKRDGTAFLIATHDQAISSIAHRTIFMEDGRIRQEPADAEN